MIRISTLINWQKSTKCTVKSSDQNRNFSIQLTFPTEIYIHLFRFCTHTLPEPSGHYRFKKICPLCAITTSPSLSLCLCHRCLSSSRGLQLLPRIHERRECKTGHQGFSSINRARTLTSTSVQLSKTRQPIVAVSIHWPPACLGLQKGGGLSIP